MNFLSSPLLLLLLFMTLSFFSLIHAREHYTLQCPKGWALYRSKTKTEDDPSKCIKLIGPTMNVMLFSEAQEYCTEKLPQLEADLVEPQMLRLTSAAQETFLNGYFYLPDTEERNTQWFLHLGLQYRPEDERWHWAASGVYEPGKSGPLVNESYALEKAKHTFDEYNIGQYGRPFKPNYPMCLWTPSWILPANKWLAVKCEEDKFRLICESKPKKVEVPDNGMDDDEIREKLDSLSTKMEAMSKELESLRLPLGFIYVQLPGEKEPSELWPS
ncbi:hypothetical protein TYRP_017470 [Tyrophagus putrescentiae]|nr:hypothetical protein TYRP_017470 [Tyrophagus putrescentiae]